MDREYPNRLKGNFKRIVPNVLKNLKATKLLEVK